MLVIPAVDVMKGNCVRLIRGDPSRSKTYFEDPVEAAQIFAREGASLLHVVDLDAALGRGQNTETIARIIKTVPMKVQVGGGIRDVEKAGYMLKLGVARVIFGTAAIKNPRVVEEAVESFGSHRVAVAIDVRGSKATIEGWKNLTEVDYLDLARSFERLKVGIIVFTSASVDGTMQGPQLQQMTKLVEAVKTPIIVSGGISSLNDIAKLSMFKIFGVIVGTAFYERKFTLREAMEVAGVVD